VLDAIRARAADAGVFLDLDGTLAPIVARPGDARVVDGAAEVLESLARRMRAVVIVTGRPAAQALSMIRAAKVRYEGIYGSESSGKTLPSDVAEKVRQVVAIEPSAWVEDKDITLAVHFRQAADPEAARAALELALGEIALSHGLELAPGKAVLELVPPGGRSKGAVVRRIADELGLRGAIAAGDDDADLDMFEALDDLGGRGLASWKIAIRGAETPTRLVERADQVVDGPEELLELLRTL